MRYEKQKILSAFISTLSVAIALAGAVVVLQTGSNDSIFEISEFTNIALVATAVAAFAAFYSILISRRLKRHRESKQVFIIYSRSDIENVRELTEKLRENGFNPWLDVDEITPGQIWKNTVTDALEKSAVALVIISENFLESKGFVKSELEKAMDVLHDPDEDKSPVIPVRVEEVEVPDKLKHVQCVNYFEDDGFVTLVKGLHSLIDNQSNGT